MPAPRRSTCSPWAIPSDLCIPCTDIEPDDARALEMLQIASDILFDLSGRQFPGTCTLTVHPCTRPIYNSDRSSSRSFPYSLSRFCGCSGESICGCGGLSQVDLGVSPVTAVSEVVVDGVVLTPVVDYHIDDFRFLVRLDGERWPCCADPLDPASFSVTFDYGLEPPPGGIHAAAELACQMLLACDPNRSGECRLPQRVTSITRQGVSMVVLDPLTFLDMGRTGLTGVDMWLASVNPHHLKRPPAVLSPDLVPKTRRIDTGASYS